MPVIERACETRINLSLCAMPSPPTHPPAPLPSRAAPRLLLPPLHRYNGGAPTTDHRPRCVVFPHLKADLCQLFLTYDGGEEVVLTKNRRYLPEYSSFRPTPPRITARRTMSSSSPVPETEQQIFRIFLSIINAS